MSVNPIKICKFFLNLFHFAFLLLMYICNPRYTCKEEPRSKSKTGLKISFYGKLKLSADLTVNVLPLYLNCIQNCALKIFSSIVKLEVKMYL